MKKFGLRNTEDVIQLKEYPASYNDLDNDCHDFLDTLYHLGGHCRRGDLIEKMVEENGWELKECSLKVSQCTSKLKALDSIEVFGR